MQKSFCVYVNGQKAVNAGYRFCGARRCTRQIVIDGKPAGQLEVVIDDNGSYNGNPNKWVAISYIKTGADGWHADIYNAGYISGRGCVAIVTGYQPFGAVKPSYDLCKFYDDTAAVVVRTENDYITRRDILDELIRDFVGDALREAAEKKSKKRA